MEQKTEKRYQRKEILDELDRMRLTLTKNRDDFLKEVDGITANCLRYKQEQLREEYDILLKELTDKVDGCFSGDDVEYWLIQEAPGVVAHTMERVKKSLASIGEVYLAATKGAYDRYAEAQLQQVFRVYEILSVVFGETYTPGYKQIKIPCITTLEGCSAAELDLLLVPWVGRKQRGLFRKRREVLRYTCAGDLNAQKEFINGKLEEKLNCLKESICEGARKTGIRQFMQIEIVTDTIHNRYQGFLNEQYEKIRTSRRLYLED